MDASEALGFEPIDGQAHIDDIGTQFGARDTVDRLSDECIDIQHASALSRPE
jgi:hypothetical protein